MTTEAITYGPYGLFVNLGPGRNMVIRRQDSDRKRTVAFVAHLEEWDAFVAALDAGADETAAVRAIDAPS